MCNLYTLACAVSHALCFGRERKRCALVTGPRNMQLRSFGGKYAQICDALSVIISRHNQHKSIRFTITSDCVAYTLIFLLYATH